jgi:hypothetical protein
MNIVMDNCGATANDVGFNPAEPAGMYSLEMSETSSQVIIRNPKP